MLNDYVSELQALVNDGVSIAKIALNYNKSVYEIKKDISRYGIEVNRSVAFHMTDNEIDFIRSNMDTMPVTKIALALSRSNSSISNQIKKIKHENACLPNIQHLAFNMMWCTHG